MQMPDQYIEQVGDPSPAMRNIITVLAGEIDNTDSPEINMLFLEAREIVKNPYFYEVSAGFADRL